MPATSNNSSITRLFGHFRASFRKLLEIYLWLTAAIIVLFPVIVMYSGSFENKSRLILEQYDKLLLATALTLFPILFNLIFGDFPFAYLRNKRFADVTSVVTSTPPAATIPTIPSDYRLKYISESDAIAEKIFSRAGVYLLVGCFIAFIGVAIFYSPWFEKVSTEREITQKLIGYLPRFGALFFIEFIAFFFLKQYRITQEEYRYYEGIKRQRQDLQTNLELIEKYKADKDLLPLVINMNIEPVSKFKLSKEESTQILEAQKIVNQDMDLLTKATEFLKAIRGK